MFINFTASLMELVSAPHRTFTLAWFTYLQVAYFYVAYRYYGVPKQVRHDILFIFSLKFYQMPEDNSIKIFFRFYSHILDEETTETLEASVFEKEYNYYKLETVPFFAPKIALGDIVWADNNPLDGVLTYRKTVQPSGNSTIHVIIMDDVHSMEAVGKIFTDMGCLSAELNHKYFALTVPAALDYIPVKRKLDELEKQGALDYAESGLSAKHEYKTISF